MKRISSRFDSQISISSTRKSRRARGFTLIEVMVALAIFAVLMVVVFVPLTQATRFMAIGRTRSELQQASNQTMSQLQRDLSRAIYVYPNSYLPGITDKAPYTDNPDPLPSTGYSPYIIAGAAVGSRGISNASRIDMLLPELNSDGSVKYPITPAKYIVTYYARRRDSAKPYDVYDNPVVLFRAQLPYLGQDGNPVTADRSPYVSGTPLAAVNADTSSNRYADPAGSRGLQWITQSASGEFDLNNMSGTTTNITSDATIGGIVPGNHILATPRNVALVTSQAPSSLVPNTTFTCADTNGDGKINQVTVSLTLTNFNRQVSGDGGNDSTQDISKNVNFQKFTLVQSIDCPNIR